MPVHLVEGDLFANRYNAQALAHGCNCAGIMGAGIAVMFRLRYPEMFDAYRAKCVSKPPEFLLGEVFLWRSTTRPSVFNLATQPRPGRCARYDAVAMCLATMRVEAFRADITSIAMPRIGAGLGGLEWERVLALVEMTYADWEGDLYVYDRYESEKTS